MTLCQRNNQGCLLTRFFGSHVLFDTIKIIAAAVDSRSQYTKEHSLRVAGLCHLIAETMGLSDEQTATLLFAAHVHDIGKIGTSETVLSKSGALTATEWANVLKHPADGSQILKGIPELSEVALVVRHHHERTDGLGYPDRLSGDAIPLLSRILAVAEAFDAMTSARPYRQGLSDKDGIEELKKQSGKQFDPEVVAAAITAIAERTVDRAA
jgi:HD-GYP domain-containing protein (c-di-GMP phosphodiesterase class II)